MTSDIPSGLTFVDPAETIDTYRVCVWGPPGAGKSVAAASAPGPLLVLSADRPSAYKFSRKHYAGKEIREVRYQNSGTLYEVFRYLDAEDCDIATVVVDPVGNIIDKLRDEAPQGHDGPDHQWVNKKMLGFVTELRRFDVNVVLVAHEKLNDGKGGDNKLYPALGGGTLINKLCAEMDIVARIERLTSEDTGDVKWVGQLQPRGNLVCKESVSGGALGERRIVDLIRWFEVASEALALEKPDDSDLPFDIEASNQADIELAEATA